MAKVFIEETTLTAIGDAIRGKTGKTDLIDPANMSAEIAGIEAGGGGVEPTAEDLTYTGDCDYLFANGRNAWLLRNYGHKMSVQGATSLTHAFKGCLELEEIPFQLNCSGNGTISMTYAFYMCYALKVCPKVRGLPTKWTVNTLIDAPTENCRSLRDIEDLFLPEELAGYAGFTVTNAYSVPKPFTCKSMNSLRSLPSWLSKFRINEESTAYPNSAYCFYYTLGSGCSSLDEMVNLPVLRCQGAQTSNMFSSFGQNANRLKAATFETNADGTPIETKWKSQTIDFSSSKYVGYGSSKTNIQNTIGYNSGIAKEKAVEDDATYQALKNDPDWYTWMPAYSRYNHDSAVETINSLPDTSTYLATAGGTNTIKFNKNAGSATDGGAINTLTEEEIAVATAKGWTVTLA
jgi:hypothetical protein